MMPRVVPELRLLRYFAATAEELSFTRAAERLYITQPSLSSAIRRLEAQIPAELFSREPRGVRLTAAGRALLPHARAAIAAAEEGARAAQLAGVDVGKVCRILYTAPFEAVVAFALDALERGNPELVGVARSGWAGEVARGLLEGEADIGVVRFPEERERFSLISLRGDRACALVHAGHPLVGRGEIEVSDLASQPVVRWAPELGFSGYNEFVANLFDSAGVAYAPADITRVDLPTWSPVVAGRAAAIVGESERIPGGVVRIPIGGAPAMPVSVCSTAHGPDRDDLSVIADAVQTAIDTMAGPDTIN
jgi:DNA-binding transcriptional LysR family regulator